MYPRLTVLHLNLIAGAPEAPYPPPASPAQCPTAATGAEHLILLECDPFIKGQD